MRMSFNSKLTRRGFLTVSAFSVSILASQKAGNTQNNHMDEIFEAGKNMAIILLPDSVKQNMTYQEAAVIQSETANTVNNFEAGGERVIDHVTGEWGNYGTGDRNHVSKCPTCNLIASRSLSLVGLVQYVPQLIVPECFRIEHPTAMFPVKRLNNYLYYYNSAGQVASVPIAALVFSQGQYWAVGLISNPHSLQPPPVAPVIENNCSII